MKGKINKNIGIKELLSLIPEEKLSAISKSTNVDHYAKVLHGKKLFYLLLYSIIENDRLSQRSLEDTFNDSFFKNLFSLDEDESVRRSSISERLSKVNVNFFKEAYELIYKEFSSYYTPKQISDLNLIPVDTTVIRAFSTALKDGFTRKEWKFIKYGVAFDGALPCEALLLDKQTHCSEDVCLPAVIKEHAKKTDTGKVLYVVDKGLQSLKELLGFKKEGIQYVAAAKEGRKYEVVKELEITGEQLDRYNIIKDSEVYFYGRKMDFEEGSTSTRQKLIKDSLRLVIAEEKNDPENTIWLITNNFDLTSSEVLKAYKGRWDIEVFFRFIKQELNTKHLISMNANGIKVLLYMTLIASMLVYIYKYVNNLGYKTAKRRFGFELRDMIIELIVIQCGGDPSIYFDRVKRRQNSSDHS